MLTRRRLLVGAGVLAATAAAGAYEVLSVPSGDRGQLVSGSFRSAAMSRTVGWSVVYPAAPAALPLLLHLHGRGGDHRDVRHLAGFLHDHVRRGGRPFAVVGVDGGDHSYYHRRRSGQDPQRMLLDELLPLLAGRGLRTGRFALGGISMGGYGALLLAERLGRSRVVACAPDSPAIFLRVQDSARGAFDGSADFAAHDVLQGSGRLAGVPLRVTCGTSDPFLPGVRRLLERVPSAERELGPGGHDRAWWDHVAPAQLAFVGRHLAEPSG